MDEKKLYKTIECHLRQRIEKAFKNNPHTISIHHNDNIFVATISNGTTIQTGIGGLKAYLKDFPYPEFITIIYNGEELTEQQKLNLINRL